MSSIQYIDELNKESYLVRNKTPKESFDKAQLALKESIGNNYKKGEAEALSNLGFYHTQTSEHEKSLEILLQALSIFENIDDEIGISNVHYNLGVLQMRYANFNLAIESLHKCLKVRQKYEDKAGMALCYFQLAFINSTFGNNAEGMDLCEKCLAIREELNDDIGRAAVLNLIGVNYTKEKQYGKARETFMKSMNLRKPNEEFRGYFATQFRWTEFQIEIGDLEDAKKSAAEGLNAALTEKEWFGAMRFMHANAKVAMAQNDDVKAQMYLEEAIKLAEERKFKSIAYELYELYSEFFQRTGKLKEALEYYKRFHSLKEEVLGAQSSSQLKSIQLMNQIESSRREAELERIRNVDLKNAFELIEEKNRDITDSIFYAQRIQQAILPSAEEFKKALPSSFVLFKPRDIVSGDFYWLSEVQDKIFFAAADCTGHGVPGAFMSMIGTTMLNEIVNEKQVHKPSEILFHLRESIVRSLKQTGASGENKDGMDIALCCLDKKNNVLEFAGAHNPLWLLKSTGEFTEYMADKQPIGIFLEEKRNFNDHHIQLQKGDTVYIFTDGYADQFGGPKGKKFKYKQLQELMNSLRAQSMDEQCKILDETFLNWKQGLDQLDDVLVIGVKV